MTVRAPMKRQAAESRIPVLFSCTLFVSAFLLFLVQPLVAKMILPKFGGTPAVWNTCMVFFQAALLGGYGLAHVAIERFGVRRHIRIHVALLVIALALAPLLLVPVSWGKQWAPPGDANPVPWLLGLLLVSVGFPFFVIASSSPALQRWFAAAPHASARDPYFLAAASNAGSMIALLGYPLLLEPSMDLRTQGWSWVVGFAILLALTCLCARSVNVASMPESITPQPDPRSALDRSTRIRWIALAFVPSSLMLGVTTYLSTDIAPVPLIWVIPLALYLLSFILVFSRLPGAVHAVVTFLQPIMVLSIMVLLFGAILLPTWLLILVHLSTFFIVAMACHGQLARLRPGSDHLTSFYLCMSLGGVLGGIFNSLIAPLVFVSVTEYYLVMFAACWLVPAHWPARLAFLDWQLALSTRLRSKKIGWFDYALDFLLPAIVAALALCLMVWLDVEWWQASQRLILTANEGSETGFRQYYPLIQCLVPALLCLVFVSRPLRFALAVGGLFVATELFTELRTNVVYRERSFFGTLRVEQSNGYNRFTHGSTVHGMQRYTHRQEPLRHSKPLTYFHVQGPIAQVFRAVADKGGTPPVAVLGLGIGSLAWYCFQGQEFTFYEIDPAVVRLARDTRFFSYLADCPGDVTVVLGDGRLKMEEAPDHHYGLIVMDAFSSDAVPTHLVTRGAFQLYLKKLQPGGLIAVNISNRYLDLRPVLANAAGELGLVVLVASDGDDNETGKFASAWAVLARKEEDFGSLNQYVGGRRWQKLPAGHGAAWTDDFSNPLSVFLWKQN